MNSGRLTGLKVRRCVLGLVVLGVLASILFQSMPPANAGPYQSWYFDDGTMSGWSAWDSNSADGEIYWGITSDQSSSGSYSVYVAENHWDLPPDDYVNNMDAHMQRVVDLNDSSWTSPAKMGFYYLLNTEFCCDIFYVRASHDGSSWTTLFSNSGGSLHAWLYQEVDLSSFVGDDTVYIDFYFHSDSSIIGNVSGVSTGVYVDSITIYMTENDTQNPTAPTNVNDGVSGWSTDDTPAFTWTASWDNVAVDGYYWAVDYVPTKTNNDGGTIYTNVTVPSQSNGTHRFYVVAVDTSGNVGPYGYHDFQIDDTAPSAPGGLTDGVSGWSSDDTPVFTWNPVTDTSGVPGYYYAVDDSTPQTGGTWTAGTQVSLAAQSNGCHTFCVVAQNGSGLYSPPACHDFCIDDTPPGAPTNVSDGVTGWSNDATPTFTWTPPSDISGIEGYYWSTTDSTPDAGDSWTGYASVTLPTQPNGSHTFYVAAMNGADLIGSPGSHAFQIDVSLPSSPGTPDMYTGDDTGQSAYDNITNDTSIRFDWPASTDTYSGIAGYWWAVDDSTPESGGAWTANTYCTGVNPTEGSHTIYVRAQDQAGNLGGVSSLPFIVDRTAPLPPNFSSPEEDETIQDTTPLLEWQPISGVWKYQAYVREDALIPLDSRTSPELTAPQWEVTPALDDKDWGWQVRAWDVAGNQGSYGRDGAVGDWGHFTVSLPGTVNITVRNYDGTPWSGALVQLFDESWTEPPIEEILSDGGGVASFANILAGNYNIQVWYTPPGQSPAAAEYWGTMALTLSSGETLNRDLNRSWPILALYEPEPIVVPTVVDTNSQAPIQIKVFNPQGGGPYNTRVNVILDRDKLAPYDVAEYLCSPSQAAISGSDPYTFDCTSPPIPEEGTYYLYYRIEAEGYSDWLATDQNNWQPSFDVQVDNPLQSLYGQPVERHEVELFGTTYSIIGLSKMGSPEPGEIVYLPFYGNPLTPTAEDLIADPSLAAVVIDTYLFDETFVDPYNLGHTVSSYVSNELVPLRDYYDLDSWWQTTFPALRIFSKRKVDRITIGNAAIWAGGELLEAKVTGGASLIGTGASFLQFLYDQGRLEDIEEEEYQALTFAQVYYGKDMDTFGVMQTLTHVPNLETLWLMKESAVWAKEFLDVEVALAQLEDAVEIGDLDASNAASLDLEDALDGLGYKFAVKLAEEFVFEPIGTYVLEDEAQTMAWLSDAHCEGIHLTAKDLAEIGTEITSLRGGADTTSSRESLRNHYYDFVYRYTHVLYPLHMEHLAVQYNHLNRVDANVNAALKWWVGVRGDTISDLADDYDYLVGMRNEYTDRYASLLYTSLQYQAHYQGALTALESQTTDGLLRMATEDTPVLGCCQSPYRTTTIVVNAHNDYASTIQSLTTTSQTVSDSSIGFSSGNVTDIAPGASKSFTIDVYVPEHYFTFNDEVKTVELKLGATWTVNGEQYSRDFDIPVTVSPASQFTSVEPDQLIYRPSELATVQVNWDPILDRDDLYAAAIWLRPDGSPFAISWNDETSSSATLQYPLPDGPFGAYGMKVFVAQHMGPLLIPSSYANKILYLVPPVEGDLAYISGSDVAIIFPEGDREAAEDVQSHLGLSADSLYAVESYSYSYLVSIASSKDTVLIGGPLANPLVDTLAQGGHFQATLEQEGDAAIQVIPEAFGVFDSVVVAGYLLRDTQIATIGLLDVWEPASCYWLNRTVTGSGEDPVASPPNSNGCPTGEYIAGELINLTASPDPGWYVGSWSGTNDDASTSISNQVSMPESEHTVTVHYETDSPIEGLAAINDSPTLLGSLTTLTATITAGSNIDYIWAFGDEAFGSGEAVSHVYPAAGVYTAVVTATNSASSLTATTLVTITERTFCDDVSEIPTSECEALVALYNNTGGLNWTDNTGWLDTYTPCTDWYGVTCSAGHVWQLSLSGNQLNGNLPPELGDLTNLLNLVLSSNQLTGSIPPELGSLSALQTLNLFSNQLNGTIPSQLGSLASLRYLHLENNQLDGNIPPELGDLTNLQVAILFDNQLTGTIPPELGYLANLQDLDLSANQLTGSVPPALGDMGNLWYLNLEDNQLTGSLPPELGGLSSLQTLRLASNQFTSTIPAQLGNLVNLQRLWLQFNALEGDVPASIVSLVNLDPVYTNLGYNMLTASDPGVLAFLNEKDPDWADTQTVPPADLQVTGVTASSVQLSWTPISYTGDGGYYQVSSATSPGGPYSVRGTTADKTTSGYVVNGLDTGVTYYFVVRTYTPAHDYQQSELWSWYSEEVSATTGDDLGILNLAVDLQGRTDHSGTLFTAWSGGEQAGNCTSASDGACSLDLPTGVYSVTAEMASYLDGVWDSASVSTGSTTTLPTVKLLGGDVNEDCVINILDLTPMGNRFGTECGDPNWDPATDINGDCFLNILDLTIAGANYGKACPVPWNGASADRAPTPASAEVALDPATLPLLPASTGVMDISVTGATDLYGAQATLTFDPAVVEVVDADGNSGNGVQIALGDLLSPDFVALNSVDNSAGTIEFALTQLAPTLPSDGDGVLATITFRGLVEGTSAIAFEEMILADSDGAQIPADVSGGVVNVGEGYDYMIYLPVVLR